MIAHLRIKNLALLESVTLELPREFLAITGETGAGKSVLVGALRVLGGIKADRGIIREGAESCEVEAALQLKDTRAVDKFLDSVGLPMCEDGQLIIYRSIAQAGAAGGAAGAASGKGSKITVNGQMASQTVLQQLGGLWLEYNSPEAVLELYTPAEQMGLLDRYGRVDLSAYTAAYKVWKVAQQRLEEAQGSQRLSPDELEFLEAQIEKIDNMRLSAEGINILEREYKRLSSIEDEMATAINVVEAFNYARRLQTIVARARTLAVQNAAYKIPAQRLEELIIEIDDQESGWRELSMKNEITLAERERIQERMGQWMELKRRHNTLEGVMKYREELADKLQLQQNIEVLLEQYERESQNALKVVQLEQQKVLKVRKAAAQTLMDEALLLLKRLGLAKAQLEGSFKPLVEPDSSGGCDFELMFNANPGQSLKPLAQIGSSGELARVMLALKTVLIKASSKAVVVFDEVDANVGGEVATAVAELLQKLGAQQQVFCITHLPQVAARANFHLVVRKSMAKNSTAVTIEAVSDKHKRLEELARMLGDRNAATALEHAKALLER